MDKTAYTIAETFQDDHDLSDWEMLQFCLDYIENQSCNNVFEDFLAEAV
jgi:hypothetical protein